MARLSKQRETEDAETIPATTAINGNLSHESATFPTSELQLSLAQLHTTDTRYSLVEDADDERRESIMTTTSVSSFPESAIMSDNDPLTPILNLYAPRPARSKTRWPFSNIYVERPGRSPLGSRSHRRIQLGPGSRTSTPKSMSDIDFRGSPRHRRRISEATEAQTEMEDKRYPLVLLHVTLLSIRLPWSNDTLSQLVPTDIMDNLRQLQAKASETILSRGILISHPHEEYDLLEDRLLEALELQDEPLTKCGHFRSRSSVSLASDSDSGVGSSIDGFENELCAICQHHIRPSRAPVGGQKKKWSIRVFAANGLLRPSAWAAAWSDMEAVDVEILPWIDADLRRRLDDSAVANELERQQKMDAQDENTRLLAEKGERLFPQTNTDRGVTKSHSSHVQSNLACVNMEGVQSSGRSPADEVPDVYRPSQIPLSVLLRNYVYLLSKDWRNVALLALTAAAMLLLFQRSSALLSLNDPFGAISSQKLLAIPDSSIDTGPVVTMQGAKTRVRETVHRVPSLDQALRPVQPSRVEQGVAKDHCEIDSVVAVLFGHPSVEQVCLLEEA